jgi:hypothetical protein
MCNHVLDQVLVLFSFFNDLGVQPVIVGKGAQEIIRTHYTKEHKLPEGEQLFKNKDLRF